MYKYLFAIFVSFPLFSAQYDYNLKMTFKRGPTPMDPKSHTVLNEKEVFCPCGKPPVCTMFFYGNPEHYCAEHIPEIEHVKPIDLNDIDALLKSFAAETNMNGTDSYGKK